MDFEAIARLVKLAKQGDEDAFMKLYEIFSKSTYYVAFRIVKNKEDADDVAQETMVVLYKNLHLLEDPYAVVAYVNKVAYSRSLNLLKKNQQANARMIDIDDEFDIQSIADLDAEFIPEEYIVRKEKQKYLLSKINQLSLPLRSVIMMYYYNRYSISKIAEYLKISESAVKMRIARAKEKLGTKIDKSRVDIVRGVMPLPVLTRILNANADELFTSEVAISIWKNIATKLGYSPEAIARTTAMLASTTGVAAIATSATTATAVTTGVAATTTGATVATGTVATITTTGATAVIASKAAAVASYIATIATPAVITAACVTTALGGAALLYNTLDVEIFTGASTATAIAAYAEYAQPQYISQDNMPELYLGYDIAVPRSGFSPSETQSDTGQANPINEEVTLNETPNQPAATTPIAPQIEAETSQLQIVAGEQITPEQILQAAGITAICETGRMLDVNVSGLNAVDFNTPDRYAVHAQVIYQGQVLTQRVIVLEVSPKEVGRHEIHPEETGRPEGSLITE